MLIGVAAETDKRSSSNAAANTTGVSSSEPGPSSSIKGSPTSSITNGSIEDKLSEFQKNVSSAIAPGLKRKAVSLERPNCGALFSSDEINFLIYRYLEENGFNHTAYLFGTESNVHNAQIDSTQVPKGALIKILQKGIFFAEAELYSVLDGEAMEKYELTNGSLSLIESAHPPRIKKMKPSLDGKVVENAAKQLKRQKPDIFARELEILAKRREEQLNERDPLREEREAQQHIVNKNVLKTVRDREHEREKDTKDHDKREKTIQAIAPPAHYSNGIASPAHHRPRISDNKRVHSATPPASSAIPSTSHTPHAAVPQQPPQLTHQPQINNTLPQQATIPQQPQPQVAQPSQQPSTSRIDMNSTPVHQHVINNHIREHSLPPQPTTQARGTPQPQGNIPMVQSSGAIGVAQPQQSQHQYSLQQQLQQVMALAGYPNQQSMMPMGATNLDFWQQKAFMDIIMKNQQLPPGGNQSTSINGYQIQK